MKPTSTNTTTHRETYYLTRWLFLRLLGVVFLSAVVSYWVQCHGLFGPEGIEPLQKFQEWALRYAKNRYGSSSEAYWLWPSISWLNPSLSFLHFLCGLATLCSILLIIGVFQRYAMIVLWVCYLSFCSMGQSFFPMQWDLLLLEVGFLGILLAPWTKDSKAAPSRFVIWMLWWVLFRLMFFSGYVKITNDHTWVNFTALDYHYWTQPLPHWVSWYAHLLPPWFQKISVFLTLVIELVAPFLIWFGRKGRLVAFVSFLSLQLLIGLTGNYGFFNLLTLVLCLTLLEDQRLSSLLPNRWRDTLVLKTIPELTQQPKTRWKVWFVTVVAVIWLVGSVHWELMRFVSLGRGGIIQAMYPYQRLKPDQTVARWFQQRYRRLNRLRLFNHYGLFAWMTKTRPELVVEGSSDGKTWKAYRFKWKPGPLDVAPKMAGLHMPRLDWQMWFAALRIKQTPYWLIRFTRALLHNKQPVLELLSHNPFPTLPPFYIRVVRYYYTFNTFEGRGKSGHWWKRKLHKVTVGPYSLHQHK